MVDGRSLATCFRELDSNLNMLSQTFGCQLDSGEGSHSADPTFDTFLKSSAVIFFCSTRPSFPSPRSPPSPPPPPDRRLRRDGPVHTASDTGSTAGSSVGPSQGYGSADIPIRSLEGGTRSPGCLYPGHEDSSTRSPGCLYPRDEDSGNSSPACTTDGNTPSGSFPSI